VGAGTRAREATGRGTGMRTALGGLRRSELWVKVVAMKRTCFASKMRAWHCRVHYLGGRLYYVPRKVRVIRVLLLR